MSSAFPPVHERDGIKKEWKCYKKKLHIALSSSIVLSLISFDGFSVNGKHALRKQKSMQRNVSCVNLLPRKSRQSVGRFSSTLLMWNKIKRRSLTFRLFTLCLTRFLVQTEQSICEGEKMNNGQQNSNKLSSRTFVHFTVFLSLSFSLFYHLQLYIQRVFSRRLQLLNHKHSRAWRRRKSESLTCATFGFRKKIFEFTFTFSLQMTPTKSHTSYSDRGQKRKNPNNWRLYRDFTVFYFTFFKSIPIGCEWNNNRFAFEWRSVIGTKRMES